MKKYKKDISTVLNKIDNKFVLIKGLEYYELNEEGARIFGLCNGDNSHEDIANILSTHYDMDRMELEQYVAEFLEELYSRELIK